MAGCASMKSDNYNGATSAKETTARGPVETVSDATINTKVKASFAADDLVKAHNINVDTVRGVVTLNGTVNTAIAAASRKAWALGCVAIIEVSELFCPERCRSRRAHPDGRNINKALIRFGR
jgi:osmotically-inducible protein OsmY